VREAAGEPGGEMTVQQLLDTLSRNRFLRTREQVENFDEALKQFASHPEASVHLHELHLVLNDQTTQVGVMYGLIHLLESLDVEKQLKAFIQALPTLQRQAPVFVKALNFRLLNDEVARAKYRTAFLAVTPDARALLAMTLSEIIETEETPLRDYACEVVAPLESLRSVMTGIAERHAIVQVRWGPMACRKAIVAPGQTLRVGRAGSVGLPVPHDSKMADAHFEVSWDGSRAWVTDLGSRTGTLLGGETVVKAELFNGSWLRASHTDFSVYFERTTPPPPTLEADSAEMAELKTQALRLLKGQEEPLYAILDAARNERILVLLRESVEEYWSLYEGHQGDALADVAPYLVRLPADSGLLEALVTEGWGQGWGIYLTCARASLEVRRHFRKFLMAQAEGKETQLYFRFYDPRTLHALLPVCTSAQRSELFSPLGSLFHEVPGNSFMECLHGSLSASRVTE
jgi:hypothetical protein